MNNLEKHVPLLETCKKLKELKYPQENSQFFWINKKSGGNLVYTYSCYSCHDRTRWFQQVNHRDDMIAAPIVTELLEFLPNNPGHNFGYVITKKGDSSYLLELYAIKISHVFKNDNLAEALALMLIHLVENKIVSFDEGGK